jgi:hypothetical protein
MGAGAIVALVGIWADAEWLVNVAIVLLVGGFLLRFSGVRTADREDEDEDEDEVEADPGGDGEAGADRGA